MLLVLAVCAAPVIASYLTYFVIRPQGAGATTATLVEPTRRCRPSLPLTALDGRAVDAASLHGQWLLVVVGGGACDAGCEQRLYLQRQLREMLGRDRDRIDKVWLIDDDKPLRPALQAALQAAPAVALLRAPRAALERWLAAGGRQHARRASVHRRSDGRVDDARAGRRRSRSKLKRDLERLLRASASWDRPGR